MKEPVFTVAAMLTGGLLDTKVFENDAEYQKWKVEILPLLQEQYNQSELHVSARELYPLKAGMQCQVIGEGDTVYTITKVEHGRNNSGYCHLRGGPAGTAIEPVHKCYPAISATGHYAPHPRKKLRVQDLPKADPNICPQALPCLDVAIQAIPRMYVKALSTKAALTAWELLCRVKGIAVLEDIFTSNRHYNIEHLAGEFERAFQQYCEVVNSLNEGFGVKTARRLKSGLTFVRFRKES